MMMTAEAKEGLRALVLGGIILCGGAIPLAIGWGLLIWAQGKRKSRRGKCRRTCRQKRRISTGGA